VLSNTTFLFFLFRLVIVVIITVITTVIVGVRLIVSLFVSPAYIKKNLIKHFDIPYNLTVKE